MTGSQSGSDDSNDSRKRHSDEQLDLSSSSKRPNCGSSPVHLKVLIPAIAAGGVIGKDGEAIERIQKQSGAKVKMSKRNDFYPGTLERVCLIIGPLEAVAATHFFVMERIYEKPDATAQSVDGRLTLERHKQVKILVPNSTAGMIIGKNGAYIQEIKERSGAYVQISQKSREFNLSERCVIVAGELNQMRLAMDLILVIIASDPQSSSCPNLSYSDVRGPVSSIYPTGSPYACAFPTPLAGPAGAAGLWPYLRAATATTAPSGHNVSSLNAVLACLMTPAQVSEPPLPLASLPATAPVMDLANAAAAAAAMNAFIQLGAGGGGGGGGRGGCCASAAGGFSASAVTSPAPLPQSNSASAVFAAAAVAAAAAAAGSGGANGTGPSVFAASPQPQRQQSPASSLLVSQLSPSLYPKTAILNSAGVFENVPQSPPFLGSPGFPIGTFSLPTSFVSLPTALPFMPASSSASPSPTSQPHQESAFLASITSAHPSTAAPITYSVAESKSSFTSDQHVLSTFLHSPLGGQFIDPSLTQQCVAGDVFNDAIWSAWPSTGAPEQKVPSTNPTDPLKGESSSVTPSPDYLYSPMLGLPFTTTVRPALSSNMGPICTRELLIPETFIGRLLGPQGRTLIDLQAHTGTLIQASHKGVFMPGTQSRFVSVTGDQANVNYALLLIENLLNLGQKQRGGGGGGGTRSRSIKPGQLFLDDSFKGGAAFQPPSPTVFALPNCYCIPDTSKPNVSSQAPQVAEQPAF
uniref:K Homology domain-containing protein n=3 Tax=Schistocephalus solidus TaxID=70667 RepID=A0A0X3P5Z4_SCHSO